MCVQVGLLLHVASPYDEVVLRVTSPGGAVMDYGLAAALFARLKATLTVTPNRKPNRKPNSNPNPIAQGGGRAHHGVRRPRRGERWIHARVHGAHHRGRALRHGGQHRRHRRCAQRFAATSLP